MKFIAIAALALISETNALQLQDDIKLPQEEELFLQLAAQTENKYNGDWGDLAYHGWGPIQGPQAINNLKYAGKAALDYTDDVRVAHSATVQGHLDQRVFTDKHNSADELNDVITSRKGENKHDAEY